MIFVHTKGYGWALNCILCWIIGKLGNWDIGATIRFMNLNLTKRFRFRSYFITYVLYRLFILSSDFSLLDATTSIKVVSVA